ncbi:hypothetical protein PAMA_011902 [Pampus argenteus]
MMFWRKDGEELHNGVEPGEVLPNHDGSFQMSVDLDLSSVKPEDWRKYECVFHLSGVKDDIVTELDKAVIRSNWDPATIPDPAPETGRLEFKLAVTLDPLTLTPDPWTRSHATPFCVHLAMATPWSLLLPREHLSDRDSE